MQNQDAEYWKEQHDFIKNVLHNALTDVENYRILCEKLKEEVNQRNKRIKLAESRCQEAEKNVIKWLQSEYYYEFQN
jgi:hypothetical protein